MKNKDALIQEQQAIIRELTDELETYHNEALMQDSKISSLKDKLQNNSRVMENSRSRER